MRVCLSHCSNSSCALTRIIEIIQPVILFETILNDLNNAYVDDVDIQKLFETGVKAMTASLDPYTEFESRTEAMELEESVSGKYGGVGLVIRGGTNLGDDEDDIPVINNVEKIEAGGSQTGSPASPQAPVDVSPPPVAVNGGGGDRSITPKISNNDESDEVDIDDIERRRARQKSMDDGIRVVSAFEGYAYDAGMRVGDKLLAIDDWAITPTTAVDKVRNVRGLCVLFSVNSRVHFLTCRLSIFAEIQAQTLRLNSSEMVLAKTASPRQSPSSDR